MGQVKSLSQRFARWAPGGTQLYRRNPYEMVFWMCLVAVLMLLVYVRLTQELNLHWIFIVYSVTVASMIVGRYVFFKLYDPTLLPLDKWNPTIHIIVPCKNESRQAYLTAKSIYKTSYPHGKLTVTFVNDGSKDDTIDWLQKASKAFGFNIINLADNVGKRKAIATALKEVHSEITVLMDSDVTIETDALTEIVRGFSDDKIAAVCGYTGVANANKNLLTKMQEQYYFLSYRLFRSAEAYFRTVNCCTGSFSAYRTSALKKVLEEWVSQTFLGSPRTFGDDRSLTHLLLKNNFDTIYHSQAKAKTRVPEDIRTFIQQQGRWRRGFLFEASNGLTHMWKRPLGAAFLFYISLLLTLMGPIVVFYYVIINPLYFGIQPLGYVTAILAITILHQIFFALFNKTDALKIGFVSLIPAIPMWVFSALLIIPLALLTLRDNRWLTRNPS